MRPYADLLLSRAPDDELPAAGGHQAGAGGTAPDIIRSPRRHEDTLSEDEAHLEEHEHLRGIEPEEHLGDADAVTLSYDADVSLHEHDDSVVRLSQPSANLVFRRTQPLNGSKIPVYLYSAATFLVGSQPLVACACRAGFGGRCYPSFALSFTAQSKLHLRCHKLYYPYATALSTRCTWSGSRVQTCVFLCSQHSRCGHQRRQPSLRGFGRARTARVGALAAVCS